jgi:hypothetical protein
MLTIGRPNSIDIEFYMREFKIIGKNQNVSKVGVNDVNEV